MSNISSHELKTCLEQVPLFLEGQTCADVLGDSRIQGRHVHVILLLGFPVTAAFKAELTKKIQRKLPAGTQLCLEIQSTIRAHATQGEQKAIPGIKNIIAVGSGKGGVGKSTTAVNLALALQQAGATVGLLDADIYGPNQPKLLGLSGPPRFTEDKKFLPVEFEDLKTMSMGYLVDEQTPMVWRGPMISSALTQLLYDTEWGALDYLIVDLPPGTGDIQLTLAKKIPVSGSVIVTTPQTLALLDAEKAVRMFLKTGVPVLGVVENMSLHVCSHCGHAESIFGQEGGQALAQHHGLPLLGQLPLQVVICEQSDKGIPIVHQDPDGEIARLYQGIAMTMAAQLAARPKSYAHHFAKIKVE